MVGGCQGDDDEVGGGCAHDVCAPRASRTIAPAPVARVAPTAEPGEFCGSHTTRSGMSVTAQGSVIAPRSVETVTGSPSATPISCAVADESRATGARADRKSTRLNSSHVSNSYAIFCLKKKI